MIKIKSQIGNLMHVKSGHIVHGCNALGVMGSGVALAVKRSFPSAYKSYWDRFQTSGLELGAAYPINVDPGLVVWNAITQGEFGGGVRQVSYDAVQTCFQQVNDYIGEKDRQVPQEVHIPMIGAARGGGNWEIIREIIEQTMDYPVTLWMPDSTVTTL